MNQATKDNSPVEDLISRIDKALAYNNEAIEELSSKTFTVRAPVPIPCSPPLEESPECVSKLEEVLSAILSRIEGSIGRIRTISKEIRL